MSMTIGRFTVLISIRPDNPAFPAYVVMVDGHVIGRQFSVPSLSDCEWLERQVYATSSTWLERSNARRRRRAGYVTAATTRQKHKAA